MAEFCLRCFNRINETNFTEDQVELSEQLELCEECGQYKVVVQIVKYNHDGNVKHFKP